MNRRMFTLASALSLILSLTTAALWVRSHWIADGYVTTTFQVWTGGGEVEGTWHPPYSVPSRFAGYNSHPYVPLSSIPAEVYVPARLHRLVGARWASWINRGERVGDAWIPMWPIIIGAAILPAIGATRLPAAIRRRRVARGLCSRCGYDLRASPSACPECGRQTAMPVGPPRLRTIVPLVLLAAFVVGGVCCWASRNRVIVEELPGWESISAEVAAPRAAGAPSDLAEAIQDAEESLGYRERSLQKAEARIRAAQGLDRLGPAAVQSAFENDPSWRRAKDLRDKAATRLSRLASGAREAASNSAAGQAKTPADAPPRFNVGEELYQSTPATKPESPSGAPASRPTDTF